MHDAQLKLNLDKNNDDDEMHDGIFAIFDFTRKSFWHSTKNLLLTPIQ